MKGARMFFGAILGLGLLLWGWTLIPSKNPTPPAASSSVVQQVINPPVVQFPDCSTPCTMEIAEIRDLYTDGEPVHMLPPGWLKEKAILYSGKGHLVIEGGNIRSGVWEFWSTDPKKVALIRVFGK